MDPRSWGPSLWRYLHIMSMNYPTNPTQHDYMFYQNFLNYLGHTLPCPTCKFHYQEYLKTNPPNLSDKHTFVYWTIDLHNDVNKRTGKKIYSYDEAINNIKNNIKLNLSNNNIINSNSNSNNLLVIFLVLLIIILSIIIAVIVNRIKK